MTQSYNQAIPFIVLAIVALTFVIEATYEIEIDLEEVVPVLAAIGVAGAAKTAIERAGAARKAIPESIRDTIRAEVDKLNLKSG